MPHRKQKVLGLSGWSGSGKTTLLKALIPALTHRGLSISTLKHANHDFDVDAPGKDSYEHRAAGTKEVLVSSAKRWALMRELRDEREPTLEELLPKISPVDLVLVEGFKRESHPKIEVHRPSLGKAQLYPNDPHIIAVACDEALRGCPLPQLELSDISAITGFIIEKMDSF